MGQPSPFSQRRTVDLAADSSRCSCNCKVQRMLLVFSGCPEEHNGENFVEHPGGSFTFIGQPECGCGSHQE